MYSIISDWWFGTFFIFPYNYWECHHPNWQTHIFQRGRYTTNQYFISYIQYTWSRWSPIYVYWIWYISEVLYRSILWSINNQYFISYIHYTHFIEVLFSVYWVYCPPFLVNPKGWETSEWNLTFVSWEVQHTALINQNHVCVYTYIHIYIIYIYMYIYIYNIIIISLSYTYITCFTCLFCEFYPMHFSFEKGHRLSIQLPLEPLSAVVALISDVHPSC